MYDKRKYGRIFIDKTRFSLLQVYRDLMLFHGIVLLSQVSYLMYLSAYKLLFINFIC